MSNAFYSDKGSTNNWSERANWYDSLGSTSLPVSVPGPSDTAYIQSNIGGLLTSHTIDVESSVVVDTLIMNSYATGSTTINTSVGLGYITVNTINKTAGGTLSITAPIKMTAGGTFNYTNSSTSSLSLTRIDSDYTSTVNLFANGSGDLYLFGTYQTTNALKINVNTNAGTGYVVFGGVNSGGFLGDLSVASTGRLAFSLSMTVNSPSIILFSGSTIAPLSNNISISHSGALNFNGTHNFDNTLGSLTFSSSVNVNSSSALSVAGVSTLGLTGAGDKHLSLTGPMNGTVKLTKSGAGVLVLSNSGSTHSGGVQLDVGYLCLGTNNAFGTGTLTLNGGYLRNAAGGDRSLNNTTTISESFTVSATNYRTTISGNVTLTKNLSIGGDGINATYSLLTLSGTVSTLGGATSSALTVGTFLDLTLTGSNTFVGGVNIQGILRIDDDSSLGFVPSVLDVNNIYLKNQLSITAAGTTLHSKRGIQCYDGTPTIKFIAGTTTIDGPINGSFNLTLTGADASSILRLNSVSSGLTGNISLTAGTLYSDSSFALGQTTQITLLAQTTLQFSLAAPSNSFTLNTNTDNPITGQTLGLNYSGTYPITLVANASGTIFVNTANASVTGSTCNLNSYTYSILVGTVRTLSISSQITGTGGLALGSITYRGTVSLSNVSSDYTGSTTVIGTLEVHKLANAGSNSSLGAPTGSLSIIPIGNNSALYPSTLRYAGSSMSTTNRILFVGPEVTLSNVGTGDTSYTSAITYQNISSNCSFKLDGSGLSYGSVSGNISNPAVSTHVTAITKQGNNTWTLSGTNTFTGLVTITLGTLAVTSSSGLGSSTANNNINVASGGCLLVNTASPNFGTRTVRLSGTGHSINLGALWNSSGSSSLSSSLALDANSTVGSSSTGNFSLGGSVSLSTLTITYRIDGSGRTNVTGGISGSGSVVKSGPGTIVVSSTTSSYGGSTTISNGRYVAVTSVPASVHPIPANCSVGTNGTLSIPFGVAGQNARLKIPSGIIMNGGTIRFGGIEG